MKVGDEIILFNGRDGEWKAIVAETMLGRGDRAWKYYRQLIPAVAMKTTFCFFHYLFHGYAVFACYTFKLAISAHFVFRQLNLQFGFALYNSIEIQSRLGKRFFHRLYVL